jgi:hypothetical protein
VNAIIRDAFLVALPPYFSNVAAACAATPTYNDLTISFFSGKLTSYIIHVLTQDIHEFLNPFFCRQLKCRVGALFSRFNVELSQSLITKILADKITSASIGLDIIP